MRHLGVFSFLGVVGLLLAFTASVGKNNTVPGSALRNAPAAYVISTNITASGTAALNTSSTPAAPRQYK